MKLFSFDTETFRLKPGLQAPPLVCLQFCYDGPAELIHVRDPACRRTICEALYNGSVWTGHNVAFDLAVIMAKWPDLIPFIFDHVDRDGVTCTIVRQKLLDIARGTFKIMSKRGYDLGSVARRHKLDGLVDKNDPYRLRYSEFIDKPVCDWDPAAVDYALQDALAERAIFRAQEAYAASHGFKLVDQFRQTRAALWLRLMECQGMLVDACRVEQYIANVREQLDEDRKVCERAGLVRRDGTKNTKAAMLHMVSLCEEHEAHDIPLTEKAEEAVEHDFDGNTWAWWKANRHNPYGVQLNEDSIVQYGDELLESYQRYATSTTQLSRAERLARAAREGVPIQASFGTLQDTGRTSCRQGDLKGAQALEPPAYGAQLQNPAKDKKVKLKQPSGWEVRGDEFFDPITGQTKPCSYVRKGPRELFVAPSWAWLCSTDYGGMELGGWAQICLWFLGESRMAEVLRAGEDPHTEIGATLAGCDIAEAYARRKGELGAALKKEFDDVFRDQGKRGNFSFQGGAGWRKFKVMVRKQSGVILDDETCQKIRKAWLDTWPEARRYLNEWVKLSLTEGIEEDPRGTFEHPISGRVRSNMWFSAFANNAFQGFCADIFKDAGWRVTYEMFVGLRYREPGLSPLFGSRIVNEVHDELITALRRENATAAAYRVAELQTLTGEEWGPDVPWPCAPALMPRWYKSADEVKHPATGELLPWIPKLKVAKDKTIAGFVEDDGTVVPWSEPEYQRRLQLDAA